MFILPLPFIAPFGAVREGFICALQGHLSREQVQGFQDDFSGYRQNGAETPARPWLCSPMPNFAPINPIGQVSERNNMYKSTTNSKISGNFVHMKQEIPENIQKVLDENNGTISSSQAKEIGRYTYYSVLKLVKNGTLLKLRNGLFIEPSRLANTMIDINRLIPMGVLCLYSAWAYYNLTTQIPAEFNVAVDKNIKITIPDYPPIRLLRWSGETLSIGVVKSQMNGYNVQIYDLEKSVCDAIKFRNKVGIDVMSEVLRNYLQRPDRNISKLEKYARELRLYSTLEKYMEVEL